MANNFFTKVTGVANPFANAVNTEANMRTELINTLDGFLPEIAKARPGLLRRARLDSTGATIPCPCVDPVTAEPDKESFCPICFGVGYLWDEESVTYYKIDTEGDMQNILKQTLTPIGLIKQPLVVFYIRYSAEITPNELIIELELNDDGSVKQPMRRKEIFDISHLWEYRADNGKLEYWKIFAHKEPRKFLNAPDMSKRGENR